MPQLTPDQAIDELRGLPKDRQRAILAKLSPEVKTGIMAKLKGGSSLSLPASAPSGGQGLPEMRAGVSGPESQPKPQGPGFVELTRQRAGQFLEKNAPTVLAGVGSLIAPGPGTAIGLAAAGGAAGSLAQGKTGTEAAMEGGKQAAYEVGGRLVGSVVARTASRVLSKYPELTKVLGLTAESTGKSSKAVQHLTAAASGKGQAGAVVQPIAATIGDIETQMEKLPPGERTVKGFLNAVTEARRVIHEEYGNALGPVANKEVSTHSIAESIRALKKPWMDVGREGAEEKSAIEAAATAFEQPRTAGQLDSLREQLNTDLASLSGKTPNARYTAIHGNIHTAIDETIRKGAREVLYPIADKAAGKPSGYFSDALERESNLIHLRGVLQQRVKSLSGAQAVSEVTPRLSSENVSLSAHPTSLPRAGVYGLRNLIAPPRELKEASKHVRKALPMNKVNTLPYQVLFAEAARATGLKGPKTKQLEDMREQQSTPQQ
jgi:hypothetical protein